MSTIKEAATVFLAGKRIAVTGVSRTAGDHGSTRPEHAEPTMRECAELGITQVWMHRMFGAGSVSDAATEYGRSHGITVIDGGCPLMFPPTSDGGHRVLRAMGTLTGKVPRRV